jgi:hypothetical protein
MKKIFRAASFLTVLVLSALFVLPVNPLAAWISVFSVSALLSSPAPGCFFSTTLQVAEIVADVFEAFRKILPALKYFSTDFSSAQAKFNQQIIAHVAQLPVVTTHDQVNGYFQTPQNARSLLTDVKLTMDTWKDVIMKFQNVDLVTDRTYKYQSIIKGAAFQLGKAVLDSILAKVNSTNISNQLTCAAANATAAKLRLFTAQLNAQGAGPMRYGLVNGPFMTGLQTDTSIISGFYFNQRQTDTPYEELVKIAGFQAVSEYTDFPSNTTGGAVYTVVFGTGIFTSTAHGLVLGDRVRVTNTGGAVPTGLAINTNYFVIAANLTANTFSLSATSGGAAVVMSDNGSGVNSFNRWDNLNAFFFEDRAVVLASRLPADSIEFAQSRGVPTPVKVEVATDSETGLSVLAIERLNTGTLDLELCFSVMFGSAVGRQAGSPGDVMDNAGLRIVEA